MLALMQAQEQLVFLYSQGPWAQGMDSTHSGLCIPTSMNNQDSPAQANMIGSIPQLRLSSQGTLGCAKVTVNEESGS